MILLARLCRLAIPRKAIVSQNAPTFRSSTLFSTTTKSCMPRKARLKPEEEIEEEVNLEVKWSDYAQRSKKSVDEVRSVTNFGSLRVDADNAPQDSELLEQNKLIDEIKEPSNFGGSYTESFSKLNAHKSDYLSLLIEENVDSRFSYLTPLVNDKSVREVSSKNESIEKQHFSFGKFKENKTIPIKLGNQPDSGKDDLNYFDELMFKESYQKFSTEEVNKIREVKVDASVEVAREQSLDPELNLIDQDYFTLFASKPMEVTEDKSDSFSLAVSNKIIKEDDTLNYIDEQFFTPQLNTVQSLDPIVGETNSGLNVKLKKDDMHVPSTSWFESDIGAFELGQVEDKLEIKTRMKAKRAEKLQNPQIEEKQLNPQFEESLGTEHKKPKKKSGAKTSIDGSALDYVRKLRKSPDSQTALTHPHELLGHHLKDRFIAATSNLQNSVADRRLSTEEDEEVSENAGTVVDVKKYKPPALESYTRNEVKELLFSKIIFDDHDIVGLWKPFGIPMFLSNKLKHRFSLECFLPDLAKKLGVEKLYEVHRLDSTTTGVVLYAKTKEMEVKLRKLFLEKKVEKSYLCICNGVPQTDSGIIDISVGEGSVGGRTRMTLRPDYNASSIISNKKSSGANVSKAVTEYRVLSSKNNASLVETNMKSGKKHQIRLHLGLGLGCPILGDHKFSYPDQLGKPQRVKGDIVQRLNIRKSKSRDLPIFLHARRISIPDIVPDGNLVITANLPHFFTKTMKRLRLKARRNDN